MSKLWKQSRLILLIVVTCLVVPAGLLAAEDNFAFSISGSATDPFQVEMSPAGGVILPPFDGHLRNQG